MSSIKSLAEIYAQVIADHRELAKARFEGAIRSLYVTNERHRPEHAGSCTLLGLGNARFLLTAAHVLDNSEQGSLYVAGQYGLVPIETDFFGTTKVDGKRQRDVYDFSMGWIPLEMLTKLGDVGFIGEQDIAPETPAPEGHVFTALGYPHSKNKMIDHSNHHIKAVIWSYSATVLKDQAALVKKLGVSGEDHVFIRFGKRSRTDTGGIVNSLEPQGISGGVLIDLGNLAGISKIAGPVKSEAKIAGLLIERRPEFKTMIATRLTTILTALRVRGLI